ncbi:MAG: PD-(D/E)XK nuclease family protein [Alphaproteobacteria bacterium]|nr:PD-(D/E)XK nuclease family protein [Alphaproteobacteria bacterium]
MPPKSRTIFNIPAGEPFLENLVAGLKKLPPTEFQSALILLPTRRACTALRDLFLAMQKDGAAMLLPAIRQLSAIDEDELVLSADAELAKAVLDIPPAISPMRRRLLLTQLIMARKEPDVSHTQAFLLAGDLGRLMDQVLIENCDFKNLANVVQEKELAKHWETIVAFLGVITEVWPKILEEQNVIEAVDRRKRLFALQIEHWKKNPPSHYVIAAGSTGSHPSTADLLQTISTLPKGAVVLPGLDAALDEASWNAISETHPQYLLKKLIKKLNVEREDIPIWDGTPQSQPRQHFLSEIMRPAEHSDDWEKLAKTFANAQPWQGMQSLTAAHDQHEAQLAALILRHVLETPDETAALVTPDRSLAVRVATQLRRWNVVVDDSAGTPLSETALAAYFTLLLHLPRHDLKPSDVMAFLKHPLTSLGLSREECLRLAREMETDFFRQQICGHGIGTWLSIMPANKPYAVLLQTIRKGISEITSINHIKSFSHWLDMHLALANAWCKQDVWQGEAAEVLSQYMDSLRAHSQNYQCSFEDYIGIFTAGLRQEPVRLRYGQHPRVHILGLIEARMLSFDHMILAGLNEGSWPEAPMLDPWMSPAMRKTFGLPVPDQHIGQTAHDFIQLAAQKNVTLLRSERSGVTPTNPSRWLLRLQAVLKMLGAEHALKPVMPWHEWAKELDRVEDVAPCEPPAVSVVHTALPAKLSATDIELWVRDPYAFYAKRVLGLNALKELDAELSAMDRGNIFHAVLDALAKTYPFNWPEDAKHTFMHLLGEGFLKHGVSADELHMMQPRLMLLAEEVWEYERARRAEVTAFFAEKRGETKLNIQNYHPVVHAKADRIDVLNDHTVHISDYKTGAIPSKAEVETALKPQLLVEAIIASNQGFPDLAQTHVSKIGYVRITEGEKLLDSKAPMNLHADAIVLHQNGLTAFIQAFLQKNALFRSAPRQNLLEASPDYARLARVAEWSKGEIEQEDAG